MTAIPKLYLYLGAVILAALAVILWTGHERQVGRLQVLLHVADSAHFADSTASVREHAAKLTADSLALKLRQAATVEVQKDRAVQARTDSVVKVSASERARAEQVLADSLASFETVHASLQRLVTQSRADSVANATARSSAASTIRVLTLALAADTVALTKGTADYNALLKRTLDAESQRDILKKQQPGVVTGIIRVAAGAVAGATAYAFLVKR